MEGNEKTKVFISWSGELSHEVAKILRKKLPAIIQSVEVFFSSTDIQKGENGVQAISKSLQDSQISIVILTKENKDKPWILFEAGCIHGHGGKFCSLLIDVSTEEIAGPLLQFQYTLFNEEDFFNLLCTVNEKTSVPLERDVLRESLKGHWADIEACVKRLEKKCARIEDTAYKGGTTKGRQNHEHEEIDKYLEKEREVAIDVIAATYCCGMYEGVHQIERVSNMIGWDYSYTKFILNQCLRVGFLTYNVTFGYYNLTETAHRFLIDINLFAKGGYCPANKAGSVISKIGKEYVDVICKVLYGAR